MAIIDSFFKTKNNKKWVTLQGILYSESCARRMCEPDRNESTDKGWLA